MLFAIRTDASKVGEHLAGLIKKNLYFLRSGLASKQDQYQESLSKDPQINQIL